MNNCKEYTLDDVMAITAIPLEDITIDTADWQLLPVIPDGSLMPTLYNAITIGVQPAIAGGTLIPIIRRTGKAKDDEADSVSGRLHTVTVNCEVDDRDDKVWQHLFALERTPAHLLLTFRDNTQAFVSSSEDTYLCTVDRDGAKTSVSFRIQNLLGIQRIA